MKPWKTAYLLGCTLAGLIGLAGCSETDFRQEAYSSVTIETARDVSVSWKQVDKNTLDLVATDPVAPPGTLKLPPLTALEAVAATRQLVDGACSKEAPMMSVLSPLDGPSYSVQYSDCSKTGLPGANPGIVTLKQRREVTVSWYRPRPDTFEIEAFDAPRVDDGTPPVTPLRYDQAQLAAADVIKHRCGHLTPTPIEPPEIYGTDHFDFRYYCGDAAKATAAGSW